MTGVKTCAITIFAITLLYINCLVVACIFEDINDFELLIRGEFSFYSKKFSKEFFLGQRVEVEIKKVDLEEMRIYLAIVGW